MTFIEFSIIAFLGFGVCALLAGLTCFLTSDGLDW